MQYFIIEKICKNACRLFHAGDSFERAAKFVSRKNTLEYAYIITGSQMLNIFFSGCRQKNVSEYWAAHSHKDAGTGMHFLYMPLPANFEEHLSDLNTLFLASNKVMDLD